MPWTVYVKYGALRAGGERVVVTEKNEEQGRLRFRRGDRITRAGNAPRPSAPPEEANMDEIELDEDPS